MPTKQDRNLSTWGKKGTGLWRRERREQRVASTSLPIWIRIREDQNYELRPNYACQHLNS